MKKREQRAVVAHHSMAIVGGFFGIYALLNRSETFGSSETANLIYMIAAGLAGSRMDFLIRLGAMFVYIGGIVFATLMARRCKNRDFRYIAIGIDIACCIVLAQIPAKADIVLALYPMFFAAAVQWLAFTQASGFNSSTVFSTNNVRQCFSGLTEYICDRDPKQLARCKFFAGTLICFHAGVIYSWFCIKWWGIKSIYACIPLIIWGGIATALDRQSQRLTEKNCIGSEK